MKKNYLRILLIWIGIGILVTTYLYLQPENIYEEYWNPKGRHTRKIFKENHYEISAAITVAVSLFITAIGLKKVENKGKKQN